MEKKGEVFNQMAIISDLLENLNLEMKSSSVIITLDKEEFIKMMSKVYEKDKRMKSDIESENQSFSVKIGTVDFVFSISKSSV